MKSVDTLMAEMVREAEKWILLRDGKRVKLFLSRSDKLRLLKLRIWEMRYRISILEILDLILPALRKNIRAGGKGLRVSVATLTGDVAETILQDRLAEKYPDGANITVWREAELDRQLMAERMEETEGMPVRSDTVVTLLEVGDTKEFILAYSGRIMKAREKNRIPAFRKSKRYRGNPWL